jgi:hypothetical protein
MFKGAYSKLHKRLRKLESENSHLRLQLGQRSDEGSPEISQDIPPSIEWQEPLNRADSIGLLGVIVGTFFVLIVPTVWYKAPALALLCFGIAYCVWLSHWTHRFSKCARIPMILVLLGIVNLIAIPQFIEQWHMEHIRSELAFEGNAPGIAYPDGDHYGIQWAKAEAEVRIIVTSNAQFPIQNLTLSVWMPDKTSLAGMAQSDSEPQGCVIRKPRGQSFPPFILRGNDGSRADVSPIMSDMMRESSPLRDHYDLLCQRILAGESIHLVLATLTPKPTVAPAQIHVKGGYETTAAEGSKRVPVDETVAVSMLPHWQ